jgi:hypothetical protein
MNKKSTLVTITTTLIASVLIMGIVATTTQQQAYAERSGANFCFSGFTAGGGTAAGCSFNKNECKAMEKANINMGRTITEPCHLKGAGNRN